VKLLLEENYELKSNLCAKQSKIAIRKRKLRDKKIEIRNAQAQNDKLNCNLTQEQSMNVRMLSKMDSFENCTTENFE
jgi:hypothetical protein